MIHAEANKKIKIAAGLFLLAALCLIAMSYLNMDTKVVVENKPLNNKAEYPVDKIIRYSFVLQNTSNEFIKDTLFKAYAPVEKSATQITKKISATHDFSIEKDAVGNQVMLFSLKNIPPYGSKVVTVTAELKLAEKPNVSNETSLEDYLKPEKYIEHDSQPIQELASRLSKVKDKPMSETVYNWVSRQIQDVGYIKRDRGALYALQEKKGDCTEYMYLAVALLRGSRVPARGVAGFVIAENGILGANEYHNWAEYYQEDRWRLLDAHKKTFDKKYEDYVAFRVFGDKGQNLMSHSQRFLAYDQRLDVRMN